MANYVITFGNAKTSSSSVLNSDTSTYSDIALNATDDNNLIRKVDVNAIRNSVHNIFHWHKGERILNPEFGLDLRQFLYEGILSQNINDIGSEIKTTLSKYEPRVTIVEIRNVGTESSTDNNEVKLEVYYKINMDADTTYKELIYV